MSKAVQNFQPSGWPEEMKPKTLAAYLDTGSPENLKRTINKWPNFPKKNDVTGRFNRRQVDIWLQVQHGLLPISALTAIDLDREMGIGGS